MACCLQLPRSPTGRRTNQGLVDVAADVGRDGGAVAVGQRSLQGVLMGRLQQACGVTQAQHPSLAPYQPLQQVVNSHVRWSTAEDLWESTRISAERM